MRVRDLEKPPSDSIGCLTGQKRLRHRLLLVAQNLDTGVMYVHKRQWIGLREVILCVWSTSHYSGHLLIFKDR